MAPRLSQEDVDRIIRTAPGPQLTPEEMKARMEAWKAEQEAARAERALGQRMIKVYDFTRPDKFTRDQTLVIQMMHEGFARRANMELSAHLMAEVHVHVASVDQLTYEEFIRSVPNPTTLARVDMDPLKGEAILEIDPSLTFTVIDRLLGGSGGGPRIQRDLTRIEGALMERMVGRFLGHLREAWSCVIDLRPRLGAIETNPMFAQIVPPTGMVVLVTLETRIGNVEGMMNLCLPYLTIRDVVPRLSRAVCYSSVRRPPSPEVSAAAVASLSVGLEVYYEGENLSLSALTALKKGSRVGLPGYGEGKAYLHAGGAPLYRLQAARKGGRGPSSYAVLDREGGVDPGFLVRRSVAAAAQAKPDALQLALTSQSAEIGRMLTSMKEEIAGLARRQEELSDQLIYQSPDSEVSAGRENAGGKTPPRPFGFLTVSTCEPLARFLAGEHPQTVALVLSYAEPALAACVLAQIAGEQQAEVVRRIATMGRTHPETVREVERLLEEQLRAAKSGETVLAGGIDAAVRILGVAAPVLESHIIDSLGAADADLAGEIKKRLFVFEDIVLLDDRDVGAILREVDEEVLLLALKQVEEAVRAKVWQSLPREKADALRARLAQMGRVRLRDVDAAQQHIVGTIRKLAEQGTVVTGREGDPSVVR